MYQTHHSSAVGSGELLEYPTIETDRRLPEYLNALKSYLGEANFQLLAACALYPRLEWDVTLRLAQAIDSALLRASNLLKLSALAWFRNGYYPLTLQQGLFDSLNCNERRRFHDIILDFIQQGSSGSIAVSSLEIIIQKLGLSPSERRTLEENEALAQLATVAGSSAIALRIPDGLRRALFRFGMRGFGVRSRTIALLTVIVSVALTIGFLLFPPSASMKIDWVPPGPPFAWGQQAAHGANSITPSKKAIGQTPGILDPSPEPIDSSRELSLNSGEQQSTRSPLSSGLDDRSADRSPSIEVFSTVPSESGQSPQSRNRFVTLQGHTNSVYSAVFSPDGQRILTASSDETVRIWRADTGGLLATLKGHTGPVTSAVFSPDGQIILTASSDKTARIWRADTGGLLATLEGHTGPVTSAVFSPSGLYLLTASSDQTARIWRANTGGLLATLQDHAGPMTSAVFSPDGRSILTASWGQARVWDVATGKQRLAIPESRQSGNPLSAVISPNAQSILIAGNGEEIEVWNVATGKLQVTLQSGFVRRAVFSRDGKRILVASWDKTARVWDAVNGQLLAILQDQPGDINSAAFSPDSRRILIASSDHIARVWNADNGQLLVTLAGHTGPVLNAVFSPDGKRILTASEDNTVRVWNVADGQMPDGTTP
jgi:WD40 repeat protein